MYVSDEDDYNPGAAAAPAPPPQVTLPAARPAAQPAPQHTVHHQPTTTSTFTPASSHKVHDTKME